MVAIDQYRLEQVFQNLLGNVIRYRSEKPPEIHISAVRRNNQWEFSVQGNGIGIHPQYKEQIFGISNVFTAVRIIPAQVWNSPFASAFLSVLAKESGLNPNQKEVLRFCLQFQQGPRSEEDWRRKKAHYLDRVR